MIKLLRSSIFAGIAIGTAGFGFLASGVQSEAYGSLVGAVLFSFGLLTVVGYRLKLYTGTAGFIRKNEVGDLFLILLGNIIGCLCVALLSRVTPLEIQAAAQNILELRLRTGALRCGLLGIGCGFIMTTAVQFARQKQYLPLLFGVPLFIVCGFTHCVADAFYYLCVPVAFWKAHALQILAVYVCIVLGNLVGCNLYRIVLAKDQYDA
ncbi:MAG: formate/nitrite transporter family protein [Bacteroidales bacterium]|nr:formate/nitrite transporter family protein [Bacteroidales bacterium]MBQ8810267.1 formate/nitrite transporter family protein [Bacteroidales bacterium]MBQ9722329.1 formate/nitrite transporter family protein [Bacteroidales bacterium]